MTNACLPRSGSNTLAELAELQVETNPAWQRRDVTGDGRPDTFCNQAVEASLERQGVPIPKGLLANEQADYFVSEKGRLDGWMEMTDHATVERLAREGFIVVGFLKAAGHGHVVRIVPSADGSPGLYTWQAGRTNHKNKPISYSWSAQDLHRVRFVVHA